MKITLGMTGATPQDTLLCDKCSLMAAAHERKKLKIKMGLKWHDAGLAPMGGFLFQAFGMEFRTSVFMDGSVHPRGKDL